MSEPTDTMNPYEARVYEGAQEPSDGDRRVLAGLPLHDVHMELPKPDFEPEVPEVDTSPIESAENSDTTSSSPAKKRRVGDTRTSRQKMNADIGRAHQEQGKISLGHDSIEEPR